MTIWPTGSAFAANTNQLTYRLYGEKGQTMKFLEKDQEILLKFLERIRKFFDIRLAPDEIVYLTHVQIRAM